MVSEEVTALVAGAGSIGRRHARNLQELGATVTASDPDADARESVAENLDVETFADVEGALDAADPDVVVVCTPNRYHVDVARISARAGCHLFIEKPLSHDMTGVSELQTIAEESDLITFVGCNFRFLPEIQKIRGLLDDGAIGSVVAARIEGGSYLPEWFPESDYRESYSAREELGGGVVLDYIHEIDYASWLFGEFESVSAMAKQRSDLDIETNDVAGILAETTDGLICEFHLDYIQRVYSRSCHIIGERGTIRWSWEDERVRWYVADENAWRSFDRPVDWKSNDMYIDEMAHFLECVADGTETCCPLSCGRQALEVALAARESATTGRHVSLSE